MNEGAIERLALLAGLERTARNFYLSLASWASVAGYEGSSNYFLNSSREEAEHETKVLMLAAEYLDEILDVREARIEAGQAQEASTLLDAFVTVLAFEQSVTKAYSDSIELVGDQALTTFFYEMLEGQVESVKQVRGLVRLLTNAGSDPAAINLADKRIGELAQ